MSENNGKFLEGFMEMEFLTEAEKKNLELVLNRNDQLNQKENARLRRLSTKVAVETSSSQNSPVLSTRSIRLEAGLRSSGSSQDSINKRSSPLDLSLMKGCFSCGRKFSILPWSCASSNSSSCGLCKSRMCKKCTHHLDRPSIDICKTCHINILFEAKSGKWFSDKTMKDSNEMFRSASVTNKNRWISMEKLPLFEKDYGSADNLETQSVSSLNPFPSKNPIAKRKYNSSSYFSGESTKSTISADAVENVSSFRKVNKTIKYNYLNVSNLDNTVKSEDSGCALDMDDETASEGTLKVPGLNAGSYSKCYFRPLQILNQNNALVEPLSEENQSYRSSTPSQFPDYNDPYYFICSNPMQSGEVMLSLLFDDNTSVLNITVHKCRNLVNADLHINCINPYIIIFLRPNHQKQSKQKTRTYFSDNNPVFEEFFSVNIDSTATSQNVILLLCHKNEKTGKDLAVGQLKLSFDDVVNSDSINKWFPFTKMNTIKVSSPYCRPTPMKQNDEKPCKIVPYGNSSPVSDFSTLSPNSDLRNGFTVGEITIALKFVSSIQLKNIGELQVWIKSVKFSDNDSNDDSYTKTGPGRWFTDVLGYQEPLAKAHLFTNMGVVSKEIYATKFVEDECYYIWSSIMKFDCDLAELNSSTLEISIWMNTNKTLLSKLLPSRCVGSVLLGKIIDDKKHDTYFQAESLNEFRLWQAVLYKHNIWIDETLVLKNRTNRS